jgi:serine protease Do
MAVQGFGEIAESLRRSTVQITNGRGQGSGIIVTPEGVIVTNAHVAPRAATVQLWDGSALPARLLSRDPRRDLAVLQVQASNLPAAPFADSDRLRVGELVIAIGNPLGFVGALTTGVVHAIGRIRGLGASKWIQSDAQLAPGNSGGPLADARGQVVGMNTMVAGGLGLAIPSNSIARLLAGGPARPALGVVVRPVPLSIQGRRQLGMLVLEVLKDSAAELASIMTGDILTGVDDRTFFAFEDFEAAVDASGERAVRLQFLRGDRTHLRTAVVRLGAPAVSVA